jgi:hypothetical protein
MYLPLDHFDQPMRVVYTLRDKLRADPGYVAQVQAMTLNAERPLLGLKGKHGLFGSDAWWESIREGRIKTKVISGVITELFFAGQDSRWGDQVNSFWLKLDDGSTLQEGIYATQKADRRLFVVGATVACAHALDELKKQPGPGGTTNYAEASLEVAVSVGPSAA